MTEREMRKMSRMELLELLLVQSREIEALREKLERAEAALADRNLKVHEAGDLAHAVLQVNQVMEAAQNAAQQYLENIEAMERETRHKCELMLTQAWEEAQQVRRSAETMHPESQPEEGLE